MTTIGEALEVILGRRAAVRLEHLKEYAIRLSDGSIQHVTTRPADAVAPPVIPDGAHLVVREVTVVREEWRTE